MKHLRGADLAIYIMGGLRFKNSKVSVLSEALYETCPREQLKVGSLAKFLPHAGRDVGAPIKVQLLSAV